MLLKELHIDRAPSYGDRPNQLQGSLTVKDDLSELQIALSPTEINLIISAVAVAVSNRAKEQAKLIPRALETAIAENELSIGNGNLLIGENNGN